MRSTKLSANTVPWSMSCHLWAQYLKILRTRWSATTQWIAYRIVWCSNKYKSTLKSPQYAMFVWVYIGRTISVNIGIFNIAHSPVTLAYELYCCMVYIQLMSQSYKLKLNPKTKANKQKSAFIPQGMSLVYLDHMLFTISSEKTLFHIARRTNILNCILN